MNIFKMIITKKELKLFFNKKGLGLIEIIIYIVILTAFLGLMIYLYANLGSSGGGMVKIIRNIFRFGK